MATAHEMAEALREVNASMTSANYWTKETRAENRAVVAECADLIDELQGRLDRIHELTDLALADD